MPTRLPETQKNYGGNFGEGGKYDITCHTLVIG